MTLIQIISNVIKSCLIMFIWPLFILYDSNLSNFSLFFGKLKIIKNTLTFRILEKICTANLYYPASKFEKCNITISSITEQLVNSPTFYYLLSKKPFEFRWNWPTCNCFGISNSNLFIKGQLISEAIFLPFKAPKKHTKISALASKMDQIS